ncbi:MAG: site-2 protease family protein [Myxococcales bacterium]|nr:site-2 protease family protein [Myxococcales bacterium]
MSILVAILGFNLLIVIHELGHYLFARWAGMRVLKFSIGVGPAILRAESAGGTVYQIGAFPVGGYVQVAGMGTHDRHERGSYADKSLSARTAVVLAGPLFNFLFAAGVYAALFAGTSAIYYESRPQGTPTVRAVEEPAASAGLKPYDTIVAINGRPTQSMRDILKAVGASEGRALVVDVIRSPDGSPPPRTVKPIDMKDVPEGLVMAWPDPPADWPRARVSITPKRSKKGWQLGVSLELARFGVQGAGNLALFSLREVGALSTRMLEGLGRVLRGKEEVELGGPVKITEMGADTFQRGPGWFFQFLAFLSVNLAFLNLLPLPALDGGRLMFLAVEAVARKPVNRRTEAIVHGVGVLLLFGLIIIVTVGDIASFF